MNRRDCMVGFLAGVIFGVVVIALFVCLNMGCSLISSAVQTVGCDEISLIASQAAKYGCDYISSGGAKSDSIEFLGLKTYQSVVNEDTVYYIPKVLNGFTVVEYQSQKGKHGSLTIAK